MQNNSETGRSDNPYGGLLEVMNPKAAPAAAYWLATVTAVEPLAVEVGGLPFYADEIRLCHQLTERIERVEPIDWRTEPETCQVTHSHAIAGEKELKIFSPLKVGDVLLCFPAADRQTLIAVDILPK